MINGVNTFHDLSIDASGLHRTRLVEIFEKQIIERDGGHFSALQSLNNKIVYGAPLIFMLVVGAVVFSPLTATVFAVAAVFLGIYGLQVARIVHTQSQRKLQLVNAIDKIENKYRQAGVIEDRDIKCLVSISDRESLESMLKAMNESQQIAAYASDPARLKNSLNKWKDAFEFERSPTYEETKEQPWLFRILEIDGKKTFKVPSVDEEWDEFLTEQLDQYYTSRTDLYDLDTLAEVLEKHPDCDLLRAKLASNLMALNLERDWQKLWKIMKVVKVKEVRDRFVEFAKRKFSLEIEKPTSELKELYKVLKDQNALPPLQFSINNIRALWDLDKDAIRQGVLHFVRNNVDKVRGSNVWEFMDMPDPIKKAIYPDHIKRYF